jgi:hypothetical protein
MGDLLLDRMERGQFSATWGLNDLSSAPVSILVRSLVPQEVALDATVQTPKDARDAFAFAAFVRQQQMLAEARGVKLRSLVLDPRGCVPYQALARLGFCTVRPGWGQAGCLVQAVQPQSLRYGLWGLPVSIRWPHPHRIIQKLIERQMAFSSRRDWASGTALHLVFDLASMTAVPEWTARNIGQLFDLMARLRDQRQFQIARLADVAQLLKHNTAPHPAQSVLRCSA